MSSIIRKLLNAIRNNFPRRKAELLKHLSQQGIDDTTEYDMEMLVSPASRGALLPTFDRTKRKRSSVMLRERFAFGASIRYFQDIWLGPADMSARMKKREARSYHKALREHYEGSAPNLFPDDRLTLYGVTDGVPQDLTYLVWRPAQTEPEVWSYVGMETYEFMDLAAYLTWILKRD